MTVIEILQDVRFAEFINNEINAYHRRPLPGKNLKYRRSSFDNLKEKGLLSIKSITTEFILIVQKKSTLPSSLRSTIELLGYKGINHVRQLEEKKSKTVKEKIE